MGWLRAMLWSGRTVCKVFALAVEKIVSARISIRGPATRIGRDR